MALALAPGCALREDEGVSTADLQRMVLPLAAMGGAYANLEPHEESSGHVDNAELAKTNVDLDDSREALIRAGRIGGYAQAFRPQAKKSPVVEVTTTAELLRDGDAASAYLEDQLGDFARMRGRKHEGVSLLRAKRFPVARIGDEAGGIEVTVASGKRRFHSTIVAFRRDRVVAAADVTRTDRNDLRLEVERLARVLESRVAGVLRGEELREPEPVSRRTGLDLEQLTLKGVDFAGASLAHEGYLSLGKARAFLREFEVKGNLGSSRISYLRAMTQVFPDEGAAKADQRFVGSGEGSRSVARRFLSELYEGSGYEAKAVEARPLRWNGRDTVGVQFFFQVPEGRMEGVLLSVRRGLLRGSVTVVGRARDVEPGDVLSVRKKLRERLAAA